MGFTIFTANCRGNQGNTLYPNRCDINNEESFKAAIAYDHVCGEFKKAHRSVDDFLSSNCIVMDNDNDHSDNPDDWIYPKDYADLFPDIAYTVAPSRNNMKVKDGKSARPRHHVYFPIDTITDSSSYTLLKQLILANHPFFDANAADAARFIFGNPTDDIVWHDGELTIECVLTVPENAGFIQPRTDIPQGQRNSTMSRFAGRVVKRYGATERAHKVFLDEAKKCNPPLSDDELNTIWKSAEKFAKEVQSQAGYIPPEEYDFKTTSLRPSDYSDIGQARVLAQEYGDELLFTSATDLLRYNGVYWEESKQQAVGAVIEFLDLQLEDAHQQLTNAVNALVSTGISEAEIMGGGKRLLNGLNADQVKLYEDFLAAKAYKAFVMKRRDMKYIASTLQTVKPMVNIPVTELDADPFILNTPSYTYDLRHGIAGRKEHNSNDRITKVTVYDPSDKGKDLWLDAVNEFFCGDSELIEYVQQMMGLALLGKVFIEALIIAYGEGGNGKSTFGNAILKVLGRYGGVMSADALTVGCRRNVKPELAEAKGKRLLIAAELEEGMRLNTSMVKQLCSTDEIEGEKKYKDPFSFTPSHTVLLYTNHLPRVGAMDEGIWRRLIVIPFKAQIRAKKDIKNYGDFLAENAGEYIIKWLIEGAEKIINRSFNIVPPKLVQDAIGKYKRDSDWLSHFLEECCEIGDGLEEKSGVFYSDYRAFCARTGDFARSTTEFYNAIEQRGFSREKRRNGSYIQGLRLVDKDLMD